MSEFGTQAAPALGAGAVHLHLAPTGPARAGHVDGGYAGLAFLGSAGGQARNSLTVSMANDVFAYAVTLQR